MSLELLSLLSTRTQKYIVTSGRGEISAEDMAMALSRVSIEASQYCRYKYLGEGKWADNLTLAMRRVALGWDDVGKWRVPRKGFVLDLCRLALLEDTDAHICLTCLGTGGKKIEGKHYECIPCHGTGKDTMRDADRARAVGVLRESWRATWRVRYVRIQAIVDGWNDEIVKAAHAAKKNSLD